MRVAIETLQRDLLDARGWLKHLPEQIANAEGNVKNLKEQQAQAERDVAELEAAIRKLQGVGASV